MTTERLLLRQWRDSDFEPYAELLADPEVMRYLGRGTMANRYEAWRHMAVYAGAWSLRGFSHWAVELRGSGEFIGRLGPWFPEGWPALEIGWVIAPRHQGQGYATEGGRVALRVAHQHLAERVISLIMPGNAASEAVARKLGGTFEGTIDLFGMTAQVYAYPPPR